MREGSAFLRPTATEHPSTRCYIWPAVNCLMVSAQTAGLLQHEEAAQCPLKGAAVNCLMVSAQTSRLLQHEEVAGTALCRPKGAAVNCLMVSAQTAGCSSMRKWPAPLSVHRKVRP